MKPEKMYEGEDAIDGLKDEAVHLVSDSVSNPSEQLGFSMPIAKPEYARSTA
jgi:hypothetical protein